MHASGLPIYEELLREGDLKVETGRRFGTELLTLSLRPTAIISSNNRMLLGLVGALADLGIPCPAGVSLLGFDDSVWTEHFTPAITVMAQPAFEIGEAAFKILLSRMRRAEGDEDEESGLQLFPAELRVRKSTAPPASDLTPLPLRTREQEASPSRYKRREKPDSFRR